MTIGLDVYLHYSGMGRGEQARWERRANEILDPIREKYATLEVTKTRPVFLGDKEETYTYKQIPEDQQKAWADECEAALRAEGFVIDRVDDHWVRGKPPLEVGGNFEQKSAIHPDHLFKVGYFRSSYNSGGINSITRELVGMDLYTVFEPGDRYSFIPAWRQARERALQVQEALKKKVEELGGLSAEEIPIHYNSHPNTESERPCSPEAAMALFRKQYTSYSSGLGLFTLQHPLRTVALIRGANHILGTRPSMFAVTRPYKYEETEGEKAPLVIPEGVQVYQVRIINEGDDPTKLPSDRGRVLNAYKLTRMMESRVEWRNPWDLIRVEQPGQQAYKDLKDAPVELATLDQKMGLEKPRLIVAYPGMWSPEGFLMYAFIVGFDENGTQTGYVVGRPCTSEDRLEGESNLQWYIDAYDVVI